MKEKKPLIRRMNVWLIMLILITVCIASFLIARYLKKTDDVKNEFAPAESINPTVMEPGWDEKEKHNVYINVGNTGYPVYVRAKIVVTWKKAEDDSDTGIEKGTVYFSKPQEGRQTNPGVPAGEEEYEGDYIMDLNLFSDENGGNSWVKGSDEFYYYVDSGKKLLAVESGKDTTILIKKCLQVNPDNAPEGYILSVEIIVQTVQAIGYTDTPDDDIDGILDEIHGTPAYEDAWETAMKQQESQEHEESKEFP